VAPRSPPLTGWRLFDSAGRCRRQGGPANGGRSAGGSSSGREEPRASGGVEVRADRLEVLAAAPPKLVAGGTEGGAELFPVRYFGRQAFLAQSPQFNKQMLVIAGFERVYEVGPVFRAESPNTSRHANEFTSLDYELAFIDSDEDIMDLHESVIAEMLEGVATECGRELAVPEACCLLEARYGWESARVPLPDPVPRSQTSRLHQEAPGEPHAHQEFRPPVPWPGDHDRRAAHRGPSGSGGELPPPGPRPRGFRGLRGSLPFRRPSPRRQRHRTRTADGAPAGPGEHPGGLPLPARLRPAHALAARDGLAYSDAFTPSRRRHGRRPDRPP